jgi:rod shape-determining protein MreD
MSQRRWVPARAAVVVVIALVLQISLVNDLRISGAMGDVVLVVVVAAGITGGADRGATYGFAAGVLYDLLVDSPFGLTALTYALIGYVVGLVATTLQRTGGWWAMGVAAAAGVAQAILFTALGNLVGVDYPFGDVPAIALALALVAAVLVLPAERALWWVHGHPEPDRLEVVLR